MNDTDIIKALECCLIKDCDNCPYDQYACDPHLERDALNLINRLKAEKENLLYNLQAVLDEIREDDEID